ncbi:class I SAM-dependent methyltransferase [Pseudonocardia sp.]|uniref:class I SAM-dependent methyltransferase n=1 Tax=Pseudonocardia sp. TaxID=60912 RepID=UPI003D0A014D
MQTDPWLLPLTGERTVPGVSRENYWFRRHEVVYRALAPACAGSVVLDAGCGEGYGAALLADVARTVVALDYDALTVAHVARRYPRVRAARANLVALPVRDGGCEAVVSLQVIEHLWEQDRFLRECRRVLGPGGLLAVSTPNRITFSPDGTVNPFHTRELDADELAGMVRDAGFVDVTVRGLHHGPRLAGLRGGRIVADQVAAVLDGGPWPDGLRADVASVTCADFVLGAPDRSLDLLVTARRP